MATTSARCRVMVRLGAVACLIAVVLVWSSPPAPAAHADDGGGGGGSSFTLPSTGVADKGVTFTVTGAVVRQVVGAPDGTFEGYVTGDKVTLSGTAHFSMPGDNLVTYLSASATLYADNAQATYHWPPEGGYRTVHSPFELNDAFSLEVPVTKAGTRTVSFSVEVRNCGDWVCGAVGGGGPLLGWIPLCGEAQTFFGDQAAKYDQKGIRVSIDQMSPQIQSAIDAWEKAHNSKATMSQGGDAVAAGMWLFSDGGVDLARWVSSFSLSPDPSTPEGAKVIGNVTVQQLNGKLYSGAFTPPAGSESALAQSIAMTATKQGRTLGVGDVYGLALDLTGGDTMLAALLAHNTLRSLARTGTVGFTGLVPDPTFFGKYLTPLRDGDSSGVWYHTFGTMYYQLEVAQGTSVPSKIYSALGVAGAGLLYIPSWLFSNATNYFFGWEKPFRFQQMLEAIINGTVSTGSTGWAQFANAAEQAFREIFGKNVPDPEKYCFNVWGTKLAEEITRRLFPTTPIQIFDSTRTNPYSNLAGDTQPVDVPTSTRTTSPGGAPYDPTQPLPHIVLTGSPVDVLLDVDGQKVILDQQSGQMYSNGDFPYPVWPYLTDEGTWGLWWVVPPGAKDATITYTATDAGTLHQAVADPATGQVEVWVTQVASGDAVTWSPTPAGEDTSSATSTTVGSSLRRAGTMTTADGRVVTSKQVTLKYSADGHVLVSAGGAPTLLLIGGLMVIVAALLLGAWTWMRRRPARAPASAPTYGTPPSMSPPGPHALPPPQAR